MQIFFSNPTDQATPKVLAQKHTLFKIDKFNNLFKGKKSTLWEKITGLGKIRKHNPWGFDYVNSCVLLLHCLRYTLSCFRSLSL